MRGCGSEPQRVGSQLSEESLLGRVARGDEDAVALFYEEYGNAVFRFVYRRAGECYEDAEEITQDTFLAAVSYAATYDGSCTPFTWLCSLARVRIADFYRRRGRRKRIPPWNLLHFGVGSIEPIGAGAADLEAVPERLEAGRIVDLALSALGEDEREVLLLRYVEQFSVREIGVLLGRSEKGIESLLMRAKKKAARHAARLL
jgi:RNA polymerase sigma-70 factor, ECF subfamily